jgi:hypothetical protein
MQLLITTRTGIPVFIDRVLLKHIIGYSFIIRDVGQPNKRLRIDHLLYYTMEECMFRPMGTPKNGKEQKQRPYKLGFILRHCLHFFGQS